MIMPANLYEPKIARAAKACPFCGRMQLKIHMIRLNCFTVVCICGCESPRDSKSAQGAVRIWNRRRPPGGEFYG